MKKAAFLLISLMLASALGWAADEAESRDSYLKKLQTDVHRLDDEVSSLQKRSKKAGAKTRVELDRQISNLNEKMEALRRKLSDVEDSQEGTWTSLKRGADKALDDVERAFKKALSFFNKQGNREETP